jgi:hypothetical protein
MKPSLFLFVCLILVGCENGLPVNGIKECGEACKNTGIVMESFSPKDGCKCMTTTAAHSATK